MTFDENDDERSRQKKTMLNSIRIDIKFFLHHFFFDYSILKDCLEQKTTLSNENAAIVANWPIVNAGTEWNQKKNKQKLEQNSWFGSEQ